MLAHSTVRRVHVISGEPCLLLSIRYCSSAKWLREPWLAIQCYSQVCVSPTTVATYSKDSHCLPQELSIGSIMPQPDARCMAGLPVYSGVLQAVMTLIVGIRVWLRFRGKAGTLGLDDVNACALGPCFESLIEPSCASYRPSQEQLCLPRPR